jgi:hypothetical protein
MYRKHPKIKYKLTKNPAETDVSSRCVSVCMLVEWRKNANQKDRKINANVRLFPDYQTVIQETDDDLRRSVNM